MISSPSPAESKGIQPSTGVLPPENKFAADARGCWNWKARAENILLRKRDWGYFFFQNNHHGGLCSKTSIAAALGGRKKKAFLFLSGQTEDEHFAKAVVLRREVWRERGKKVSAYLDISSNSLRLHNKMPFTSIIQISASRPCYLLLSNWTSNKMQTPFTQRSTSDPSWQNNFKLENEQISLMVSTKLLVSVHYFFLTLGNVFWMSNILETYIFGEII